jgi:hypothetical protein
MCSERKDDEKLASHQTIRRTNIYLNSYSAGALSCELMGCCFEVAATRRTLASSESCYRDSMERDHYQYWKWDKTSSNSWKRKRDPAQSVASNVRTAFLLGKQNRRMAIETSKGWPQSRASELENLHGTLRRGDPLTKLRTEIQIKVAAMTVNRTLSPAPAILSQVIPHIQAISFHIHTISCCISMRYPFNILTYPEISCFNIHTFGFLVSTIGFLVST